MSDIEDVMRIAAESEAIGRKNERADVLALLRKMANDPNEDEDWSRWAEQLAEVLELGRHEGYAAAQEGEG